MIVRSGLSALGSYADHLPGWIPSYIGAGALGFDAEGIDRSVEAIKTIRLGNRVSECSNDVGILGT